MKVRIGHLGETLGTVESTPSGFRYEGNSAEELQEIVAELQHESGLDGDHLLREIAETMKGYWWAQDVADDQ